MSSTPEGMTSNRPYLLRALYEWINDNGLTPHVLIDAESEGVDVPDHTIQKGKVVLNIAAGATENLQLENETIFFKARFSGNPYNIVVPMAAVIAIYARENGQGMMFAQEEDSPPPPVGGSDDPPSRSHLKVVK
ncbi:MAG: ClpXP protease specificity-enhancing factor [Xanthomonadales bacterium]|nr:ClpXP protease specificity-enhancing factor [Xanthomonadales bacterium]MDH4018360.1 ClpXP protease specificity-enhancing factor [Xanthomonadales bacterium]